MREGHGILADAGFLQKCPYCGNNNFSYNPSDLMKKILFFSNGMKVLSRGRCKG
jgi:hypothetical protein